MPKVDWSKEIAKSDYENTKNDNRVSSVCNAKRNFNFQNKTKSKKNPYL